MNSFEGVESPYRFHRRDYDAHRGDYSLRNRTCIPEWSICTPPDAKRQIEGPGQTEAEFTSEAFAMSSVIKLA
ncbi:MAG: hypothetical protein R6V58_10475 [Planctomycetota bacterium]